MRARAALLASYTYNDNNGKLNTLDYGNGTSVKYLYDSVDRISEKLGIGPDECTADGKFSLEACRCIGACGLAPVLTVNDEVYGKLTGDDIPGILEKYMA